MSTLEPHPEEDTGEPWGAWRVLGAALEARQGNYYCKFSPGIRINPENAATRSEQRRRSFMEFFVTQHDQAEGQYERFPSLGAA